jgi:hypothetical protein
LAEILKLKRIVDIEYSDITIDSNIYYEFYKKDVRMRRINDFPKNLVKEENDS